MNLNEIYIKRCLELAALGTGKTAPNPMVGAVIVYENKIIGEGYHQKYGEPHAEVNAINSVKDKDLLHKSTLYVSLEPCCHHGKTPPCSNLIVSYKIPKIVIGCRDSNDKVCGKGIQDLVDANCEVIIGVLEKECREINKFFFTHHEKKRPYIILKWAQTADGYIDIIREKNAPAQPTIITNEIAQTLVHKWRTETQSIMVGTNTALQDNPMLNVRRWTGNNPTRIIIDKDFSLPLSLHLFDNSIPTIVFTAKDKEPSTNVEYIKIDFNAGIINQILKALHSKKIQSILVEGGAITTNSFIKENMWDEARVFVADKYFTNGIKAPVLNAIPISQDKIGNSILSIFKNKNI